MTFVVTRQNENQFSFALATPKVHILFNFYLISKKGLDYQVIEPLIL